jgi:drug/metabolite transporter (DMT)-like permease
VNEAVNTRRWNWPLWTGLVLSVLAFFSYFFLFYRWPVTRDIPWVNLILFVAAVALLVIGFRRSRRKILGGIVAVLGIAVLIIFGFATLVVTKQLPPSPGVPRVGQKAPDFTLLDTNRRPVSLLQLLSSSPRGVVLVFYRGHW